MSASDARRALQVSGQLCWNPTDLSSGSFPWGGTALGFMKGHALKVRTGQHVVRAEELGVAIENVYAGEEWVFVAVLGSWDLDALGAIEPGASTGATTGRSLVSSKPYTDGARQGTRASTKSGILYFSPDAPQHPGVLFHKALPMRAEDARIEFHAAQRFGYPIAFLAVPDDNDLFVDVGLRGDLSV